MRSVNASGPPVSPILPALILSAGDSRRMGTPKALLPDGSGGIFITRIVRTLLDAELREVTIVTGRHHDAIVAALERAALPLPPHVVRNPDPARGQLSSLFVGMLAVCRTGTEAVLVTLVDVPMVRPETVRQVVDAWRQSRAPIVRPAFGERRGHPVVFDRAVFDELRDAPLETGARTVVRAHAADIVDVPVDDPGCIIDVDTPDEYDRLLRNRPPA